MLYMLYYLFQAIMKYFWLKLFYSKSSLQCNSVMTVKEDEDYMVFNGYGDHSDPNNPLNVNKV